MDYDKIPNCVTIGLHPRNKKSNKSPSSFCFGHCSFCFRQKTCWAHTLRWSRNPLKRSHMYIYIYLDPNEVRNDLKKLVDDDQIEMSTTSPNWIRFYYGPFRIPDFPRSKPILRHGDFLRYQSYSSAIGRISGFFGFHLLDLMYIFTYSYHKTQAFMQLHSFNPMDP